MSLNSKNFGLAGGILVGLTDERFELVKAVFLDEEPIEIDNSLLNKGEQGTTSILYPG